MNVFSPDADCSTRPDPLEIERAEMVHAQIRARGIRSERVLDAMRRVPRHLFVPPELRDHAHDDRPLQIGSGQTISQPYMVALMTELLDPLPSDRILEIGTGSGYQAAVLSCLAGTIISIERDPVLAGKARDRLKRLSYDNVTVLVGDGTVGCLQSAPYNGIVVTAAAPYVPDSLRRQLAEGGRLVCPVGSKETQRLHVVTRAAGGFAETKGTECVFVPLIGAEGWPD